MESKKFRISKLFEEAFRSFLRCLKEFKSLPTLLETFWLFLKPSDINWDCTISFGVCSASKHLARNSRILRKMQKAFKLLLWKFSRVFNDILSFFDHSKYIHRFCSRIRLCSSSSRNSKIFLSCPLLQVTVRMENVCNFSLEINKLKILRSKTQTQQSQKFICERKITATARKKMKDIQQPIFHLMIIKTFSWVSKRGGVQILFVRSFVFLVCRLDSIYFLWLSLVEKWNIFRHILLLLKV